VREIHIAGPSITEVERHYVADAMDKWYGRDAYYYVELFEREFAKYIGRKHCLMTPNATSALHLAVKSLGIHKGDEVIAPPLTWIASVAPVVYEGATPFFVDVDRKNWCLSPMDVALGVSGKTKAVIAVDLHGNMPDMDALTAYCNANHLWLIEDSAQAIGSSYLGRRAGTFGAISVFSFHRTKTLVTGEGGAFLTDDDRIYETAKMYRDHGRREGDKPYWNRAIGYKYMPSNILAALAYGQLVRIDELVERKRWIFKSYHERLSDIAGITLNEDNNEVVNGAWVTGLVWDERYPIEKEQLMTKMQDVGIPPRPFFYLLPDIPAFSSVSHIRGKTPNALYLSEHGVNLPCALDLDEEQIDFICRGIRAIFRSLS
jgi:perosamine synthetase